MTQPTALNFLPLAGAPSTSSTFDWPLSGLTGLWLKYGPNLPAGPGTPDSSVLLTICCQGLASRWNSGFLLRWSRRYAARLPRTCWRVASNALSGVGAAAAAVAAAEDDAPAD